MSKSFALYLSLILNAALILSVFAWRAANDHLLDINANLMARIQTGLYHQPHDVPLTVHLNYSGDMEIRVYGTFRHRVEGFCRHRTL